MGLLDRLTRRRPQAVPPPDDETADARRVDQAVGHILQGDFRSACPILLAVAARTPPAYAHRFEDGDTLHVKCWDAADFDGYVAWLRSRGHAGEVACLPNAYPRAYYYLGWVHIELGNFDTAVEFFDRGLALEPGAARLSNEKAHALTRLGRFRLALSVYDGVLSADGYVAPHDLAVALRGRGFVLIELGDLDGAEAALRRSLWYEPDSRLAADELGHVRRLRERPAEAARLGLTLAEFDAWYHGYQFSLSSSGHDRDWSRDIEGLGRELGALTEADIEAARTDFHQAIVNRIRVRVAWSRRQRSD
jgi:tetratricopeptide (TPR) repeat protein